MATMVDLLKSQAMEQANPDNCIDMTCLNRLVKVRLISLGSMMTIVIDITVKGGKPDVDGGKTRADR
jgi:hypothetical protein